MSPDLSKVLEELIELAFILTDRVRGKTECYVISPPAVILVLSPDYKKFLALPPERWFK